MPSVGESIEFNTIIGDKLSNALKRLVGKLNGIEYAKVDGIIDTGETCSVKMLLKNNEITHICMDCDSGEVKGDKALLKLEEIINKEVYRGYLDLVKLSKSGYEIDASNEPDSKLSQPKHINSLLGITKPAQETSVEVHKRVDANSSTSRPRDVSQVPHIGIISAETQGITSRELASLMMDLIFYSNMLRTSKNIKELFSIALEHSKTDEKSFYRVVVELVDRRIVNIFIYKGKVCNAIIVEPMGLKANFSSDDPETLIDRIGKDHIKIARLYKVTCEQCKNTILGKCVEEEKASERIQQAQPEEGRKKDVKPKSEKRRGWLSRLFKR